MFTILIIITSLKKRRVLIALDRRHTYNKGRNNRDLNRPAVGTGTAWPDSEYSVHELYQS